MSFEIEGKLHKKFDTESKTPTFQAREFVIVISEDNYPQYIKFQLINDRCGLVDKFEIGDTLKVYFDLKGREWNEKYFTNLGAWKIEPVVSTPATSTTATPAVSDLPAEPDFNEQEELQKEDFDDLPF